MTSSKRNGRRAAGLARGADGRQAPLWPPPTLSGATGYLRSIDVAAEGAGSSEEFPWSVPAIRGLRTLRFDPKVTFLVGENGSGKSTLLEAIADVAGFPGRRACFPVHYRQPFTDPHVISLAP